VIFGIFPLAIRIRFRQRTLSRTVLSFFSSSTRAPFQKTPRFCSPTGLLIFQNLSSPRILEWMAIYKPLTIFLKANSIYFPVRVQCELRSERLPRPQLIIIANPPPQDITKDEVIPNNTPHPFTFQFSKVPAVKKIGGTVKVVDTRTFTVSEKISAAEVEVEVGGMR
jgi:hypothetical protein